MIAAWLVYSLAVGALLYAGARALELVAHALDLSTRFIWVAAIAGTVALSSRQLVRLAAGLDVANPSLERRIARRVRATAPVALVERQLDPTTSDQPIRQALQASSPMASTASRELEARSIASTSRRSIDGTRPC